MRTLIRFSLLVVLLTFIYMVTFRLLMHMEGQETTWATALYWVLTVMSTLGFGDMVFASDLGRMFTVVVLLTGMLFLLVLLPFIFIELFYIPWSERQKMSRTPSEVPNDLSGHVILTHIDTTAPVLRRRLEQYGMPHVLISENVVTALKNYDAGWNVMVGDLDLRETYERAGLERAALVAATGKDAQNAHVAFTVRETHSTVPIIALANDVDSVDVLELAGCTEVIHLAEQMGDALARRVCAGTSASHTIGNFDNLLIAEATVRESPWVGQTLQEADIRRKTGASVVGIWEQGSFNPPTPQTVLSQRSILLLAGDRSQLDLYDSQLSSYANGGAPILIIGGGRVGRAAARALERQEVDFRVIEKDPSRLQDDPRYLLGNGADLKLLEKAGISSSPAVLVTTHEDDLNVFLVLYCRKLRPDVQILSRATRARNVETLHRAGADFVLSYATMGANAIFDHLHRTETLTVAEGLYLFRVKTPEAMVGMSLAEAQVRPRTGATVVALEVDGEQTINPNAQEPITPDSQLILIGSHDAENRFIEAFQA